MSDIHSFPGLVGLAISYALSVTDRLSGMVTSFTETEKQMVGVERAVQYIEGVPSENKQPARVRKRQGGEGKERERLGDRRGVEWSDRYMEGIPSETKQPARPRKRQRGEDRKGYLPCQVFGHVDSLFFFRRCPKFGHSVAG